jgi:hypothetical protein
MAALSMMVNGDVDVAGGARTASALYARLSVEETAVRLATDAAAGLDPAEAARRRAAHGPNELAVRARTSKHDRAEALTEGELAGWRPRLHACRWRSGRRC